MICEPNSQFSSPLFWQLRKTSDSYDPVITTLVFNFTSNNLFLEKFSRFYFFLTVNEISINSHGSHFGWKMEGRNFESGSI